MRFVGPAPADLRIEPLGVLTACYHRPSGRTHLLTEPAPEILALITERAMDRDEILAELAQRFELDREDAALDEALAARLDELVEAGLAVAIAEGPGDA